MRRKTYRPIQHVARSEINDLKIVFLSFLGGLAVVISGGFVLSLYLFLQNGYL